MTVLRYTRSDELEPVAITWYEPDGTLYDFSSGWTWRARIGNGSGFLIEKTNGFTGAATAPNLQLNFTTGELDGVASGSYHLDIQATLSATQQTITRTWMFQVLAGVGTDTLPQSPISLAVLGDLTVGGDITLDGDLIGFPELASSDPAKMSISTVDNVTTLGVEKLAPEVAYLTATSAPVNNSTALVDITGLAVPVAANAVYLIDAHVLYTSSAVANFNFGWSTPAGVSGLWSRVATAVGQPVPGLQINGSKGWSAAGNGTGNGFSLVMLVNGLLVTTNAGTLQARFAQNTTEATNTVIDLGTWLRAERVA